MGTHETASKEARLTELACRRQATRWPGYHALGEFHNGAYECPFVSPYTKTAGNVHAAVMVLLQDWAGADALAGPLDEPAQRLGYTPTARTNTNLIALLRRHLSVDLEDTYATNVFPFVKSGPM